MDSEASDSSPAPLSALAASSDDRRRLWRAVNINSEKLNDLEQRMPGIVHMAVKEAMPGALLSDEQYQWVLLAIKRESQSIAFRQAVIEKTTIALIWAIVSGFAYLTWTIAKEFFTAHGWKP